MLQFLILAVITQVDIKWTKQIHCITHYKVTTTDMEGPTEPDARAGKEMQPVTRIMAVVVGCATASIRACGGGLLNAVGTSGVMTRTFSDDIQLHGDRTCGSVKFVAKQGPVSGDRRE